MKEKSLLSVVVPVYNNEKYLEVCIDSILQQKYSELEVILVDDGSTDSSGQICKAYELKDDRVRVIQKKNEGTCYARRDGALAARGEYITFVDSDDWIDLDMYQELYGLLAEHGADIVTSGFVRNECEDASYDMLPEGVYTGKEKEELCANMLFHKEHNTGGIILSVCTKIYRRTLFVPSVTKLPANIHLWEDLLYTYPSFFFADKIVVTHKSFYHYRRNEASVSSRFNPYEYEQTVYTLAAGRRIYKQYGKEICEAFALECCWIFYNYLWKRAANIKHQYGANKEVRHRIEVISKDSNFLIPVQAVAQQISIEQERIFLQLLLEGEVKKAIHYCRLFIMKQKALNYVAKIVHSVLKEQQIQKIKAMLSMGGLGHERI